MPDHERESDPEESGERELVAVLFRDAGADHIRAGSDQCTVTSQTDAEQ